MHPEIDMLTWPGLEAMRPVWRHAQSFRVGGVDVRLRSTLDPASFRVKPQLLAFAVEQAGAEAIRFSHVFDMPPLDALDLGTVAYRQPPWILSVRDGIWFYRCVAAGEDSPFCLAVFSDDYRYACVYHRPETAAGIVGGECSSMALLPTDQIWLCPLMAARQGLLLHASAVILDGKAFVFAGKSGAGKSTTVELLRRAGCFRQTEVLCDDRIIVRRLDGHWQVHGTWSHGSIPDVSPASAPLGGIFLLEQSGENRLIPVTDPSAILHALLAVLIRPLPTDTWWRTVLGVLESLVRESHVDIMQFDRSGNIVKRLAERMS